MRRIAGIIGPRDRMHTASELDRMLKCMNHVREHVSSTHTSDHPLVEAGSVGPDDTDAASAFAWNSTHDVAILLNGEIYSEPGPDAMRGATALLRLYDEGGVGFLQHLNGWFCGLIIDNRDRKLILFNDRYGVGRICYHQQTDRFHFASEAKAILTVLPHTRTFDPVSLGEHLSCGAVLQNRTLFAGISLLPPGSAWTFALDGTITKTSYFAPHTWEDQPILTDAEYYRKLKEVWLRRLPGYFDGKTSIALSLTGGVDSRMILAWLSGIPATLVSYTFGGKYRECHDVTIARRLAKLCGVPHTVISLDGDFVQQFPALAEEAAYASDGTLDATGAIDVFVQRAGRTIAPVRVTGTNGGEILRRLVAFGPAPLTAAIFQPELNQSLQAAANSYRAERNVHGLTFTAFKQVPWFMNSKFAVERAHLTLRMPYFDNELVALAFRAPPSFAESNTPALRLIAEGNPGLTKVGTDRGLAQGNRLIALVARPLREFTFKAEYAYDYGMPQWLARVDHVFAPLRLERLFLGRHKFNHFRVWYRDELSAYVKSVLLDSRAKSRPYLRRNAFERMVENHVAGRRNHTREIHKLLALELVQRQLLETN
jgi:asparagine synthase (glutamine-hydrolysing)